MELSILEPRTRPLVILNSQRWGSSGGVLKGDICCYLKIHTRASLLRSHKRILLVFGRLFYFKCIRARATLKKSEALSAEIAEMEKGVKDAGLRNSFLRSKTEELNEESEALRAQVEVGHAKHRELLSELELRKEEKVELLGNRYELFIVKMDTATQYNVTIEGALTCYDVNIVSFCDQRPCGNEATEHHKRQKAAS